MGTYYKAHEWRCKQSPLLAILASCFPFALGCVVTLPPSPPHPSPSCWSPSRPCLRPNHVTPVPLSSPSTLPSPPPPMAAPRPPPANQPLGINPYDPNVQPAWYSAYDQCLQLQIGSSQQQLYARCLGYLLEGAVDEASRDYLAAGIINSMGDVQELKDLAKFYINHIFRLFRQSKGGTPAPSHHPSRESFEIEKSFYAATVESAPKDHSEAKKAALRRDSYRCMVTGKYDSGYAATLPVAKLDTLFAAGFRSSTAHLAHIFPPSTNMDLNPETYYSRNVWGIVNCFAHINVLEELDGPQIHRLSNVLTLSAEMHNLFGNLMFWFEEVPNTPNSYHVCSSHLLYLGDVPNRLVTFTTTDDTLDLPDARYLKLHAAICRVVHMSGAAEYLNSCDREQEERGVMARDGTSAEYLTAKLNMLMSSDYPKFQ